MILVFDVGNTELTIGLFSESELRGHWRVMTDVARTSDEFGVLPAFAARRRADSAPDVVDSVAIGSVVPRVTEPLSDACVRYFTVGAPLIVDASADLPITLDVDEPLTVGADRLINTLAASRHLRARRDRRRHGHGDDVRLHHGRRRIPRRRDRAGRFARPPKR